ncbi:MAG: YdeI/OmpD-associated family protein [Chloroflexota bacterium]
MSAQDDGERFLAQTAADWAAWLDAHHARPTGVWLVTWRPGAGRPVLAYEDAVVEALRYGWIDSRAAPSEADRTSLWFSPRRPGSPWAATNKARIARLEAEGRLESAGRRMVEQAKADGTWAILDGPEALLVPDDLAVALGSAPGARATWDGFPPSVRKAHLTAVALAKRPATRAQRVATIAAEAAAGRRAFERAGGG